MRTFPCTPTLATQSVRSNLSLRWVLVLNQLNICVLSGLYLRDLERRGSGPNTSLHWDGRSSGTGPGPAKEGSSSSNSGFPSMTVPVCLRCAVASSPSRVALKTPSMPRESGLHQGSARKEMDVEKHPFLMFVSADVLLTTVHSNKQHYDITVLYKMTQTLFFIHYCFIVKQIKRLLFFDVSFIDPYLILNCFKRRLNYLFLLEIWWIFLIWGLERTCKVSRHGCVLERRKTIWRLQWCWGQTESHWFPCNSPKITTLKNSVSENI